MYWSMGSRLSALSSPRRSRRASASGRRSPSRGSEWRAAPSSFSSRLCRALRRSCRWPTKRWPGRNCHACVMTAPCGLRSSLALIASFILIAACTRVDSTAASTTTPAPLAQPEAEAWAMVRAAHPAVPIVIPAWLPASVDRTRVEVRGLGHGPTGATDPLYTVAYVAPSGAAIIIGLGRHAHIGTSKIGTRVRNSPAVLSFGTMESSGPWKRISWRENGYDLRIDSDRFSGDDVLHVAWSLDPAGAPAPKNPYTRMKPGICAARSAAPEDTVRRLLALVGGGDRDAVMDCFSL